MSSKDMRPTIAVATSFLIGYVGSVFFAVLRSRRETSKFLITRRSRINVESFQILNTTKWFKVKKKQNKTKQNKTKQKEEKFKCCMLFWAFTVFTFMYVVRIVDTLIPERMQATGANTNIRRTITPWKKNQNKTQGILRKTQWKTMKIK